MQLQSDSGPRRTLLLLTAGAVVLRLALFLGRGNHVGYDEAFYLLLGQNLWAGEGYTLTGLRHVALSPLFAILAGGVHLVLGDLIWSGRIVAAATSGLLVLPCWSIFHRLTGRRTALLGCTLVAVMPSLAPFSAPYWVGWDLWVGAEPVFHLFLFSGIALTLSALKSRSAGVWMLPGAAFALAYLARPEAVIVAGLLGLVAAGTFAVRRTPRTALAPLVFGLAFALVASPYWIYLHDTLGRWTLNGRGVRPVEQVADQVAGAGEAGSGATNTIEEMLWQGDMRQYVRTLYSLNASGTQMASTYWGVPQEDETAAEPGKARSAEGAAPPVPDSETKAATILSVPERQAPGQSSRQSAERPPPPNRGILFLRALARVVPWLLWPLALVGIAAPRRRSQRREQLASELVVAVPLIVASGLIAGLVAIDPRTQLFLAPLLALYVARGIRYTGIAIQRRFPIGSIYHGFAPGLLAAIVLGSLFVEDVRQFYLGATVGSELQIVATVNRQIGEALQSIVPADGSVMSWNPSIALYARREWRVLPRASFPEIVNYAAAVDGAYVVFSMFYPSPIPRQNMPREHLVVRVPPDAGGWDDGWQVEVTELHENYAIGSLEPL